MALVQKLLSICIPTYNRASSLEELLNVLIPQVLNQNDLVEICISNNASSDRTHNIISKFSEKFPDLIKYNENIKNLGFDANLIKVVSMASGHFVWIFGDDDSITENGVNEVIRFIEKNGSGNIGLVILGRESYLIGENSKKLIYDSTINEKKPVCFSVNRDEIMAGKVAGSFMSVLVFNNTFIKKIVAEDVDLINRGCKTYYIHVLLYRLMFLRFPNIVAYMLNKLVIQQKMPHYKFFIEDEFNLLINGRAKIEDILASSIYAKDCVPLFLRLKRNLVPDFITRLAYMKAFGTFNYHSFPTCLTEMFCANLSLYERLLLVFSFILFSVTPSVLLRGLMLSLLKKTDKDNWEKSWVLVKIIFSLMGKNGRSRLQEPPFLKT